MSDPDCGNPDPGRPDLSTVDLTRLDDEATYARALGLLTAATDRLLRDVGDLDDAAAREPSACPGWTRGHVLTHLARNADGLGNLLTWARTGTPVPMYPSRQARDADIEAGAGRPVAELEEDVVSSAERLREGLATLPADRRDVPVVAGGGQEVPAREVLWFRIREVTYHHVDLRTGVRFADLPRPVLARGLPEAVGRVGLDPTEQGIHGSDGDLLGWLAGRESGSRLHAHGRLPELPAWG